MPKDWPLAANYTQMIQNPKVAFKDPELCQATIKRDAHNQPFGMAGQFAVVYKATLPDGRNMAIRAFTSANDERSERYHRISEYLSQQSQLQSLVGFKYHDKGIRSTDGKMYPLVTMEWVAGESLYEWVRAKCLDRNDRALRKLADDWVGLDQELTGAKIAHGDLQHGNVMVTDKGQLKLVDYDCMCVPKLVGRPNLEIGVEPYQHPKRDADTLLSATLDSFSAIFIFVALRALAASPKLWDKYVEQDKYDKLLIRRRDFDSQSQSELYKDLLRSPDSDVGRVSKELFELFHADINSVPALQNVLFSWDRIRILLSQRLFDDAVKLIQGRGPGANGVPADMAQTVPEAVERVKRLAAIQEKVRLGDEAGMKQLYDAKLLGNYPAAAEAVAVAQHAAKVVELLDKLNLAKKSQKWRDYVSVWDGNQQLLESRKSAQAFKNEVATWRQRNQACDALLALAKLPKSDPRQLSQAWESLNKLGGHPEAEPHRASIESRLERDRAWALFQAIPDTLSDEFDAKLSKAWQEKLFAGWDEAEQQRPRLNQAKQRLDVLRQMQVLAQQNPQAPTLDGEQQLLELARSLPKGYQCELAARAQSARARLLAAEQLAEALKEGTVEATIVAAAQELSRLQAASLMQPAAQARVKIAQQRIPLLNALKQINASSPLDQLDQLIMARWRDDLLKDCPEAQQWRASYDVAVQRKALLGRLKLAVEKKDELAIAKLVEEPCLRNYPLPRDWSLAVTDAQERIQRGDSLIAALRSGDRAEFLAQFDAQLIKQSGGQFQPFLEVMVQWIKEELLPREKIGLKPSNSSDSLVTSTRGDRALKARWLWPEKRISDLCLLTVCRQKPKLGDDPRNMSVVHSESITRDQYQAAGMRILHARDDWAGCYVAAWVIVDVGFATFASEPLILGRHGSAESQRPQKKPPSKGWGFL